MVRKRGDCVVVTEYPHSLNIWQVGLIIGYLTGLVRCVASVYACRRLFWKATRLMFAVNAANIGMQNVFMWAYGAPMRMPPIWETPEGGLAWVVCQLLIAVILRPSVRHTMHRRFIARPTQAKAPIARPHPPYPPVSPPQAHETGRGVEAALPMG